MRLRRRWRLGVGRAASGASVPGASALEPTYEVRRHRQDYSGSVIPAKAGIQLRNSYCCRSQSEPFVGWDEAQRIPASALRHNWIPAFVGMTSGTVEVLEAVLSGPWSARDWEARFSTAKKILPISAFPQRRLCIRGVSYCQDSSRFTAVCSGPFQCFARFAPSTDWFSCSFPASRWRNPPPPRHLARHPARATRRRLPRLRLRLPPAAPRRRCRLAPRRRSTTMLGPCRCGSGNGRKG